MALRADGTGDYGSRTSGGFLDAPPFTICFWVYREGTVNTSGVFGLRNHLGSDDGYCLFYNYNNDGSSYAWEQGGGAYPNIGPFTLPLNTWHFIGLSYASTASNQATTYRRTPSDSALTAVTGTFPTLSNGSGITQEVVLAQNYDLVNTFLGRIAALKQWSAALTAGELLTESYSQAPRRFANLHSWRPMIHGSVADAALDFSGNGRNLTPNGSLLIADGPPAGWMRRKRIFIPSAGGGGTTFNITPSGLITPSGALLKQAQKILSGSTTPTGAVRKSLARSFTGATTPAGALVVLKAALRSFTGSIALSGALLKQDQKQLAGTVAPTGAVLKTTARLLSGSTTPTSTLANIKAILRNFAGVITPAGAIVKRTGKALAGTITPAGALLKSISKSLTGSITPTGALSTLKVVLRTFTGAVTPTSILRRSIAKSLTGSITPTGAITKALSKLFSGILTLAGNLINFVAGSPLPKVTVTISDRALTSATLSDSALTACTVSDEIGG